MFSVNIDYFAFSRDLYKYKVFIFVLLPSFIIILGFNMKLFVLYFIQQHSILNMTFRLFPGFCFGLLWDFCYVPISHFGFMKLVLEQIFQQELMETIFPELLHINNSICSLYLKVSFAGYKVLGSQYLFLEYLKYITLFSSGIKH